MAKNGIASLLESLREENFRSDEIEQGAQKWIRNLLQHLDEDSASAKEITECLQLLLTKINEYDLRRVLQPNLVTWVTSLLTKSTAAKCPSLHLSVLALLLHFNPTICNGVRRKSWLNLNKFIQSSHGRLRLQSAIILASASKKEDVNDLLNELTLQMNNLSPSLILDTFSVPSPRATETLNESFLITSLSNTLVLEKIEFISKFISTYIKNQGAKKFPIRRYLSLLKGSALKSGVYEYVSEIMLCLIRHHTPQLISMAKHISLVLFQLLQNTNRNVEKRTRYIIRVWFERTNICNGIIVHQSFTAFIKNEIKLAEQNRLDAIMLLVVVTQTFGLYLTEQIFEELAILLMKKLTYLTNVSAPELKKSLFDLVGAILQCQNDNIPVSLNYMQILIKLHISSKSTDGATLVKCRNLSRLCDRLIQPYHNATFVKYLELRAPPENPESVSDSSPHKKSPTLTPRVQKIKTVPVQESKRVSICQEIRERNIKRIGEAEESEESEKMSDVSITENESIISDNQSDKEGEKEDDLIIIDNAVRDSPVEEKEYVPPAKVKKFEPTVVISEEINDMMSLFVDKPA